MSATQAFVTPSVLRWARERAGISIPQLSKRINAARDRVAAWELGELRPTIRQAQHLANALHIPFGYLFLHDPPDDATPVADFRTVANKELDELSSEVRDLLDDALLKQAWYREFLEEEGRPKLSFVGSLKRTSPVTKVAEAITNGLGLDEVRTQPGLTFEGLLSALISNAERIGLIVMRSGVVGSNAHRHLDVDEFRGFALCDEFAPLVFVNSADAKAAQLFTFVHEIVHIWIGISAISNQPLDQLTSKNETEQLCNQAAAEVLAPGEQVLRLWDKKQSAEQNVTSLRRRFHVSGLVVIRRARDVGAIDQKSYQSLYSAEYVRLQNVDPSDGGNFYNTFFARNGQKFAHAVIGAVAEGRTTYREGARLLNVKVPTLNKLADEIRKKVR